MKLSRLSALFVTAINEVVENYVEVVNTAYGNFSGITLDPSSAEWSGTLIPFGEYPTEILLNGKKVSVVQVVDAIAANEMKANFESTLARIAHLGQGLPIYEGHADDPEWRKANPGSRAVAVGRIKKLEIAADGLAAESKFNARGKELLSGDAPQYSAHSVRWRMRPIAGRPGHYRPYLILSDGLTNNPNIPGSAIGLNESPPDSADETDEPEKEEDTITMNPDLLKRLNLKPDATPAEIEAAVAALLDKAESATAANERITQLESQLKSQEDNLVATAINEAVTSHRITEAEKPTWEKLLRADYATAKSALDAKSSVTAINTKDHLGHVKPRNADIVNTSSVEAMTAAARDFAQRNNIDVSNEAGWSRAWNGAMAENPAVFGKA